MQTTNVSGGAIVGVAVGPSVGVTVGADGVALSAVLPFPQPAKTAASNKVKIINPMYFCLFIYSISYFF
jgi:hypothetical protein